MQFEPLGKVEIGPVGLSTSISHIHVDFVRTLQSFQDEALLGYPVDSYCSSAYYYILTARTYDLFDIDASQFDRDFYQFRTTVKELEARLAAVLNQAFEACSTVDAVLKVSTTHMSCLMLICCSLWSLLAHFWKEILSGSS